MKRSNAEFFTPDQVALIRDHMLKGAPDFEIDRFLITCERTGLDPFSRQVHGQVQRKKVRRQGGGEDWVPIVVIITSIDGFRAIAERSGEYRGQTPPEWYYTNDEGKAGWYDVFITPRDQRGNPMKLPDACRVGIIREGFSQPCYGVANFSSFAKFYKEEGSGFALDAFWKKMPEHMIAKVAEAQGHRKAFPLLASGLFVEEEIGRDDEEAPEEVNQEPTTTEAAPEPEKTTKRTRATKPKETPAEPAKEPEATKPGRVEAEQDEFDLADEVKEEPKAPWEDHKIECVGHVDFKGKRLGDMDLAALARLCKGWAENPAKQEDIDKNPKAKAEAALVIAARDARAKQ